MAEVFSGKTDEQPDEVETGPTVSLQCRKCLTYVGRGKSHKCKKKTKQENLESLVKSSPKRTKGKVTSACLKAVFAEAGVSIKGGSTVLPTGSRPITVSIGAKAKGLMKSARFTAENMVKLQTVYNLSDRTTLYVLCSSYFSLQSS